MMATYWRKSLLNRSGNIALAVRLYGHDSAAVCAMVGVYVSTANSALFDGVSSNEVLQSVIGVVAENPFMLAQHPGLRQLLEQVKC